MKDWRGTEIEVGKPVLTHSKNFGYGLGTVQKLHKRNLTINLEESNYWSPDAPKTTLVTIPASVTVLTEDMVEMIIR